MNNSDSSQPEKVVIEGKMLDTKRCRDEDWGGKTPVTIRAYRTNNDGSTVYMGRALLDGGVLRDVDGPEAGNDRAFPARIGGEDNGATPAQNQDYLMWLRARTMNSTYGPHYSFQVESEV